MSTYLPPIPQAPTVDVEPVGNGWWCGSLYSHEGTALVQCFQPSRDAALAAVRECQRAVIRGIRQKLARSN